MSYKTCPDWPGLMELAPELQFKHMTVAEAHLPVDVLASVTHVSLGEVEICCDVEHHVFNHAHTDPEIAAALRGTHWYEVGEWASTGPGTAPTPPMHTRDTYAHRVLTIVVPYRVRRSGGCRRPVRAGVAVAMLGDVVRAWLGGRAHVVVTDDPVVSPPGPKRVPDPGGGQGAAVSAGLAHADGHALVVNADLPCVTAEALRRLAAAGLALVPAPDGTTNALSLPDPGVFVALYGPGSAGRFLAHASFRVVEIPELSEDVDTIADLERLAGTRGACRAGTLLAAGAGEGRAAVGRRRRRAVRARTRGRARARRADRDRQRRRRRRSARPSRLSGPRLAPLRACRTARRGAWLGEGRGDLERAEAAAAWGGEDWFKLGDLDLGLHLVRTQALRAGEPLSTVTGELARAAGLATRLLPATDDGLRTTVHTGGRIPVPGVVRRTRPPRRGG